MKQFIYTSILLFILTTNVNGQTNNKPVTYTTYLGSGLSMSQPSHTPFTWELMAHYHINRHFTIGAGSGLSFYEKLLIPLYASTQFFFTKPKKVVPYLECNIGEDLLLRIKNKRRFLPLPFIWNTIQNHT